MIRVPFDIPYHGDSMRASHVSRVDLEKTLDNAYKTMEWFRFLSDKAERVEILETYKDARKHTTTTVVGFDLDGKNETFYRLKYERYEVGEKI
jgi:predicted metal-binding protein